MSYYCPVKHQRTAKPCDCTLEQRVNAANFATTVLRDRPPMVVPAKEPQKVVTFKHQHRGGR